MEAGVQTQNNRVSLESFEGPLDLLLALIKREEIDIYDIPIARLLERYLESLELAKEISVDLAGEFLEMASELTYIKSRMLLPEPPVEEEELQDPRAELVRRLLEHQRFKKAAESLLSRPLLGRDVFCRGPADGEEAEGALLEADTVSLLMAFQTALKNLPQGTYHEVQEGGPGVAERVIELMEFLKKRGGVPFEELFVGASMRAEVVVTFLGILEMAKQGLVRFLQEVSADRIFVQPLFSEETT